MACKAISSLKHDRLYVKLAVAESLRNYDTSRKVAGSRPDEMNEIF
jgi:hypothetical protein